MTDWRPRYNPGGYFEGWGWDWCLCGNKRNRPACLHCRKARRHFCRTGRQNHRFDSTEIKKRRLPGTDVDVLHEIQSCECGAERVSILGAERWRITNDGVKA